MSWVGLAGFEPATSASQTPRAAKLRHSPFTEGYSDVRGSVSLGAFAQPADRSDPVAVCTDDLAFSGLRSQDIGCRLIYETRDFAALRTDVVEVHRLRRKRNPTVGARLILQRANHGPISSDPLSPSYRHEVQMVPTILVVGIPLSPGGIHTASAIRLKSGVSRVSKRERLQWPLPIAARATPETHPSSMPSRCDRFALLGTREQNPGRQCSKLTDSISSGSLAQLGRAGAS